MSNIYSSVDVNKRKSAMIMAIFVAFISASVYGMAYAFGMNWEIVIFAFIGSVFGSFFSYYFSDKIILGISGARPAERKEFFDFYTVAENLCLGQQLPMPKLYVIEDSAMNAFATGRDPDHAVVCATTGLLARLDRAEVEAVVAHELAHVKNYDIRLMSLVTVLVGMIALVADLLLRWSFLGGGKNEDSNSKNSGQLQILFLVIGILLAVLSPIIAQLIQLAISRRREFLADATGAAMTKYPEGLVKALQKISQDREPLEVANKATAHLYFSNPLKNHHDAVGWFAGLFNTHPPVEDRIKALRGE